VVHSAGRRALGKSTSGGLADGQRGTVQHEILDGEQATAFVDGQALSIQVNCRAQTGTLEEEIPYGLAVSLEVTEGIEIPIYDEIRERLRVGIPIEARIQG